MRQRERSTIQADPGPVWDLIGNPEQWPRFNPKLKAIQCPDVRPGARILASLQFRDRPLAFEGTLTEVEAFQRIAATLTDTSADSPRPARIAVVMTMRRRRGKPGIEVTETVDLDTPMPWIFKIIAQFLMSTGKKHGSSNLDHLKRILEKP